MQEYISTFNTSILFYDDAKTIAARFRIQELLNIKAYYNTKIQASDWFHYTFLQARFRFFERFNEIIHRMKGARLLDFWDRQC